MGEYYVQNTIDKNKEANQKLDKKLSRTIEIIFENIYNLRLIYVESPSRKF